VEQVRADLHSGIFYLGHSPAIKKVLTPMENLSWFCASSGAGHQESISKALAVFGLKGYDDIPCYMMSAGQQRRVSLARLLLSSAKLWILDEPFTALDKKGVGELEVFLAEHVNGGGAVILTTHHHLQMPCEVKVLNLDGLAWDTGVQS
ncbi:MAG: heme ABC exporter ATP-binding protein CcmA, partial [Pseudohongiellaceae bacterium]